MTDSTGDIEHTLYNIYGKDANKKFKFGTYESSLVDKKDYPSYNVNPKTPKLVSVEQKARSHDARKKK
jgi:penicillin V acylase-like amidase (Ntn superfamily)